MLCVFCVFKSLCNKKTFLVCVHTYSDQKERTTPLLCASIYGNLTGLLCKIVKPYHWSRINCLSYMDQWSSLLLTSSTVTWGEQRTFITYEGLYHFCRVLYGLFSGPSALYQMMIIILKGLDCVQSYLDDTIVHGSSEASHNTNLKAVLYRINEVGWYWMQTSAS